IGVSESGCGISDCAAAYGLGRPRILVLTRPLGRAIAETGNSNPARQATFDGGFDQTGARKASEIVMLTLRTAQFSRVAICSTSVSLPAAISSSQRRPRAIDATSLARVSISTCMLSFPENVEV